MCDAFIWTIFNLFDPNCIIDGKVWINFIIPKVCYIYSIITYRMDIVIIYLDFDALLENSGLLDWDLSVPFNMQ